MRARRDQFTSHSSKQGAWPHTLILPKRTEKVQHVQSVSGLPADVLPGREAEWGSSFEKGGNCSVQMACSWPKGYHDSGIYSCKRWCESNRRNQTLPSLLQQSLQLVCAFLHQSPAFPSVPANTCKTDFRSHLINMQQYANGFDWWLFYQFLPLLPHGSLSHRQTHWTHLCITTHRVFLHACVCALYWSPPAEVIWPFNVRSLSPRTSSFRFDISGREKWVQTRAATITRLIDD